MKKLASVALLTLIPLTLASCSSTSQKETDQSSSSAKSEKVVKSSKSSEKKNSSVAASKSDSSSSSNSSSSAGMSRSELTKAESKNDNQPLKDETVKNEQDAINLLTKKYGDQNWKVAFNSIGQSSPIYFHIKGDDGSSYYVYANGDIQNASGDLSDHESEIQNIK